MDHLIDDDIRPHKERELTLSTGALLGLFLGLAILCGAFFGFGYNMGRKSVPSPLNLPDAALGSGSGSITTEAAKPSAGTPDDGTTAVVAPEAKPPARPRHPASGVPSGTGSTDPSLSAAAVPPPAHLSRPVEKASETTPAPTKAVTVAPISLPSAASAAGTGSFMVQIAAVSHKEDADLLLGALRGRGYSVATHTSPADNFIHVQVGPFASKKDAEAMRQHLIADGYNAIVK